MWHRGVVAEHLLDRGSEPVRFGAQQYAEPEQLDIDRAESRHLAFGHGIHHCLGAALARLEMRVALEVLLPQLGEYRVHASDALRVHSGNVRGFSRLPIEAGR